MEEVGPQDFRIDWDPTPKGRPQFSVHGGRAIARTPAKTVAAENAIRYMLKAKGARAYQRDTPLQVTVVFAFKRPPSAPRGRSLPTTKPDVDNCFKLLADAANGILWEDQQIVAVALSKVYAQDDTPHILLGVQPL